MPAAVLKLARIYQRWKETILKFLLSYSEMQYAADEQTNGYQVVIS